MKKKLFWLITALSLALMASIGTYAATATSTGITLAATAAGGNTVQSTTANPQPDWSTLLPHREPGLEILRPDGPGGENEIQSEQPNGVPHWQAVADVTPDDWASTVYSNAASYKIDTYNLANHAPGSGTINSVTVYFRFAATEGGTAHAQAVIKVDDALFAGDDVTTTGTSFVTRSYRWVSNPETHRLWTWREIDSLQAGVQIAKDGGGSSAVVTQVYVIVDYLTDPIIKGAPPTGNLFRVTPQAGYTGDLAAKVYLTNTAALAKAYRYLNMKVYATNSLEAGQNPNYQILSLDNGAAGFNLVGGSANYTISITGGSYTLLSGDTSQWASGWSIVPELYLEVGPK